MKLNAGAPVKCDTVHLAPEDGLFELSGAEPAWIWVHTCPDPKCECRLALVLATNEGRDALLEPGAAVHKACNTGGAYRELAATLHNVLAFDIDIDTTEAFALEGEKPLDLAKHPPIAALVERIDGDLLDAIGQLWYRGKGWLDPEEQALSVPKIKIYGWQPGAMLAWDDAGLSVRGDFYWLEDRLYEAGDFYCPAPECKCGKVVVAFETRVPRGAPSPGHVIVQNGVTKLEPNDKKPQYHGRLEQLWAAFSNRHPRYLAHFARRERTMKRIGTRLVAVSKVGRNDPCPCGSGKKYKKCCASVALRDQRH